MQPEPNYISQQLKSISDNSSLVDQPNLSSRNNLLTGVPPPPLSQLSQEQELTRPAQGQHNAKFISFNDSLQMKRGQAGVQEMVLQPQVQQIHSQPVLGYQEGRNGALLQPMDGPILQQQLSSSSQPESLRYTQPAAAFLPQPSPPFHFEQMIQYQQMYPAMPFNSQPLSPHSVALYDFEAQAQHLP